MKEAASRFRDGVATNYSMVDPSNCCAFNVFWNRVMVGLVFSRLESCVMYELLLEYGFDDSGDEEWLYFKIYRLRL